MGMHMDMLRAAGEMIRENSLAISRLSRACEGQAAGWAPWPEAGKLEAKRGKTVPRAKKTEGSARPLEALLDPERYTARQISRADLNHIIGLYGSSVEDIYEPGAGQRWMLEEGQHVKNAFFLQILTKAVIQFEPPVFRQRADEVCRSHESLRSAFVIQGTERPYRVVLKDRHPEINCFDYSDLDMDAFDEKIQRCMESDRQRGFDLERDSLLRINIYKSCEKDTYAIILSQPHVNSDGTSLGILFSDLFIGYALDLNGIDKKLEAQSYQAYAEHLNQVDAEKELSFWRERLRDLEEDQLLPGQLSSGLDYDSTSLAVPFEDGELEILKQARKTYGVTQFTLLQGLWGLMVAGLKGRDHAAFGVITSGRDADVSDSMTLSGGFVNALPMKVTCRSETPVSDYFKGIQREFRRCLENSHCSPGQIRDALGRKEPVFSHLLNQHNFVRPKGSGFSQGGFSGIRIIGGDVYDNLSADLCVYFTNVGDGQGCNYAYNARAFSGEVIQLLAEQFKALIAALKDAPADMTLGAFPKPSPEIIAAAALTRRNEQLKIAGALKKHPVFSGTGDDELLELAGVCRLEHYAADEIIVKKGVYLQELPILLRGTAVLHGETREGWSNPLRVRKSGSILSFAPVFEEEKTGHMTVNGQGEALVLLLPRKALTEYLARHPEGTLELARQLHEERNIFMKLWTNAD